MIKSDSFFTDARRHAEEWARDLLARPTDWVIIDTETTGFAGIDQVIEISVIDGAGNVLVENQRFKPTVFMSEGARQAHGISIDQLQDQPTFKEFVPKLLQVLAGKLIIIYNAEFDRRLLYQTSYAYGCDDILFNKTIQCAMLQYAKYVGEFNNRRMQFRWQKLPAGDHSSLGDCVATLQVIRTMGTEQPVNENM